MHNNTQNHNDNVYLKDKNKKISRLQKVIIDGRIAYTNKMALALTVGMTIGKIFTSNLIKAILSIGIQYIIFLVIFYFLYSRTYRKAIIELQSLHAAIPPQPTNNTQTYTVIAVTAVILMLPLVFKDSLYDYLKSQHLKARKEVTNIVNNSKLELTIADEKGNSTILNIPYAYLHRTKIPSSLSIFPKELEISSVSLAAKSRDFEPLAKTSSGRTMDYMQEQIIYMQLPKEYSTDRNLLFATAYKYLLTQTEKNAIQRKQINQLDVLQAVIPVKTENTESTVERVFVAKPIDNEASNLVLLICDKSLCSMKTEIDGKFMVNSTFSANYAQDWKLMEKNIIRLMRNFINNVDPNYS